MNTNISPLQAKLISFIRQHGEQAKVVNGNLMVLDVQYKLIVPRLPYSDNRFEITKTWVVMSSTKAVRDFLGY